MTCDTNRIRIHLETHGWIRAVAGDTDFNAAVEAVALALEHRLGLIVSGEYGVGKTALANAAASLFGRFRRVSLALPEDTEMLTREWMVLWSESLYDENVLLDDVGAEAGRNDYGVRTELVSQFVTAFHARRTEWSGDDPPRLVITTNLNSAEIDARYGGRFYSRLKDLCVPFRLTGGDKRKWVL